MIRAFRRFIYFILIVALILGVACFGISYAVKNDQDDNIKWKAQTEDFEINGLVARDLEKHGSECILILGAGVYADGTPSPMLRDRLDVGIALYNNGIAPKILISGDNGQEEYNEIGCMLTYLLKAGVDKEDIFCDHAGFSTYDSMYRAQKIFQVKKMVVVTQTYHLYRALYIANNLGIDAIGVSSDQKSYSGQIVRNLREVLARDKDVLQTFVKVKSKYEGDAIPINGKANSN